MNIIAFDLGTNCGYAYYIKGCYGSGVLDLKSRRFEGGGMRYLRFRTELQRMLKSTDSIDLVVFEEVRRHRGTDAAHVYGGLLGQLSSVCEEHKIPYEGVTVQAIKKFASGKGNCGKEPVIAFVESFGFSPKDDNEADALALLMLTMQRMKK